MSERMYGNNKNTLSVENHLITGNIEGREIQGYFLQDKIIFVLSFQNKQTALRSIHLFKKERHQFEKYSFVKSITSANKSIHIECDLDTFTREDALEFLSDFITFLNRHNIWVTFTHDMYQETEVKYEKLKYFISLVINCLAFVLLIAFFTSNFMMTLINDSKFSSIMFIIISLMMILIIWLPYKKQNSKLSDNPRRQPLLILGSIPVQMVSVLFSTRYFFFADTNNFLSVFIVGGVIFMINFLMFNSIIFKYTRNVKIERRKTWIQIIQVIISVSLAKFISVINVVNNETTLNLSYSFKSYDTALRYLRNYDQVTSYNMASRWFFYGVYFYLVYLVIRLIYLYVSNNNTYQRHTYLKKQI